MHSKLVKKEKLIYSSAQSEEKDDPLSRNHAGL